MKINSYLNFQGNTEEAFKFYQKAFGGELMGPQKFKDMPDSPDKAGMSEADLNKVMHVALKIGDNLLMGTDSLEAFGQKTVIGTNVSVSVHPDSREEADRLFAALSEGGKIEMPMAEAFWGDYFGALVDKFGTSWMINAEAKK